MFHVFVNVYIWLYTFAAVTDESIAWAALDRNPRSTITNPSKTNHKYFEKFKYTKITVIPGTHPMNLSIFLYPLWGWHQKRQRGAIVWGVHVNTSSCHAGYCIVFLIA